MKEYSKGLFHLIFERLHLNVQNKKGQMYNTTDENGFIYRTVIYITATTYKLWILHIRKLTRQLF